MPVRVVRGSERALKVTEPGDFARVEALYRDGRMTSAALAIPFWSDDEVAAAIRPALEQLELRRVLAYPTETVYGFGGAIDRDSVDALDPR